MPTILGQPRRLCNEFMLTMRGMLILVLGLAIPVSAADKEAGPKVTFTEHLIAGNYGYAYGVAAADLDGDGDLDLTSGDTIGNALYWFENDGKGAFSRHIIQEDEEGWFERQAIGDINGDKLPDIVIVKNFDGHLV